MKGSIRQRTPGSYELTIDMGRDELGRRRRKFVTIRGMHGGQSQSGSCSPSSHSRASRAASA